MDYQSKNEIPNEIKGWNWGAFMYTIRWGIGNKSYLPLLCLIPLFNIFWIFVCGFKGNEWAWKNGDYQDTKTFLAVQETWKRSGLVSFVLSIILVILTIVTMYNRYSSFYF